MELRDQTTFTFRKSYLVWAVLLLITEILIALFMHDNFIRPWGGDFLVVILLFCFLRGITNLQVEVAAIFVLVFSYLIETLQFFHVANRLGLESNAVARTVIGTNFSWSDIGAYTLGILFVLVVEKISGNAEKV